MKKLVLLFVLLPSILLAQGYPKRNIQSKEKRPPIEFQITKWAIGFGSFFDAVDVTFSTDALFVAAQFHGIGFPFIKEGTSTGVSIEGHPAKVFTEVFEDSLSTVRLQAIENLDYRVWSITRVPVSAIPLRILQTGTPARVFTGVDALIAEGGPSDFTGDFDARFVMGGDLGRIGPGTLVVEIYSFQRDVPISFSVFYGF